MKLAPSLLILAIFSLSAAVTTAEEFGWSWDKENAAGGNSDDKVLAQADTQKKAAGKDEAVLDESELFDFKWKKGDGAGAEVKVDKKPADDGIAAEISEPAAVNQESQYKELLKDNLALREKLEKAEQGQEGMKKENDRLSGQVKNLDQKIAQLTGLVDEMKKQKPAKTDDGKLNDLETQLADAIMEKQKLGKEIVDLQKRLAESASKKPAATADVIQPGSDLFKEKEKENIQLKNKLYEIETERAKAVKAAEDIVKKGRKVEDDVKKAEDGRKELEKKLENEQAARKKDRKMIENLLEQIPQLEKELVELKKKDSSKEVSVVAREKELEAMRIELQKREQRQIKAEKMAVVLDKAREEVAQVSDVEKRDMHYNMAVVYAKEGRFEDAEQEYLHALRIDPSDPAVHYNLGILYDDELNDKKRAAMHYRRYLRLNPHGADVDQVKGWLMKIDMGQ